MKILIRKALGVAALGVAFVFLNGTVQAQNGLLREVYSPIFGGIAALTNDVSFPGAPSSRGVIEEFEAPANVGNNYGQRVSGYIQPPVTGNYVFWISSDDGSRLFLSTDENPENRSLIAWVNGWTGSREWELEPNQRSNPIRLEAGRYYYIEALMVEGGGSDHLAVRWQVPTIPEATIEEPIPSHRLFAELIPPQVVRDPATVTVTEGQPASFSVQLANLGPVSYQWRRNGVAVPGATNATYSIPSVAISDDNTRYSVALENLFGSAVSREAHLFVNRDVAAPAIVSAQTSGEPNLVSVTFTEALEPASAADTANYLIFSELGIQIPVLSATLAPGGQTVLLQTVPLQLGTTYNLSVSNVRDRADRPNTIEPDSRVEFSYEVNALRFDLVHGRRESLGPSSRRTGLVISEIMYNPGRSAAGRNLEYIEIFNSQETIETIGGYRITGAVDFTFPEGTFISPKSYLVVAAAPADVRSFYGLDRVYGPFTPELPNGDGLIQLLNNQGALLLDMEYGSRGEWPAAADGAGHSLVLARPTYGEADPFAWGASALVGGSPGREEPLPSTTYQGLVVNEFLANTEEPDVDFIELYNYSANPIDLSGISISDNNSEDRFSIPAGTVIPPLGFATFDQEALGFAFSAAGERIILRNPQRTRVIASLRFEPQASGVSMGRHPDGSPRIMPLERPTPNAANASVALPEIVISEIMYNPLSGNQEEEYLELHNRGENLVNLGGWRLAGGINLSFPPNTIIPAGAYLAVAKNLDLLRSKHPGLNALNSAGSFGGNLANGGERIELLRPAPADEDGAAIINYILVDAVEYEDGGRWNGWADGRGSSLELKDVNADNDFPSNWAASDESAKSEWTTLTLRGIMSYGSTNFNATSPSRGLHVLLMDRGEALIDNVSVVPDGGTNLVRNPGFEEGMRDWVAGGTHDASTLAPGMGADGGNSLHIRTSGRGDTAANRIRSRFADGVTNGTVVTISADVRWLRGTPEILLRMHGNYLELPGTMSVPENLGTPGLPNSQAIENAGPAIANVTHSPVLPLANQSVTVIAEITDPGRIALPVLKYRTTPGTNFISVPMSYNGAGYYSASIPGQPDGTMIAFYVEALDASGASSRFPDDAPVREALIHVGDRQPGGAFGTYRLWVSDKNIDYWEDREQSSNKPVDATFVYNNERVIYNMGTLYSGSPFHWPGYDSPLGNSANYVMVMPDDDLFLGQTDFVLMLPSNLGSDATAVREQVFFWMAGQVGQPYNHRRYHHLFINGMDRGNGRIFEDAQQPNRDFVEQWFPNQPDGELYKIEDWFEFSDSFARFNRDATLNAYYTTNLMATPPERELKREPYRWWFRKRAVRDSAHNYSELFNLVESLNTTNEQAFIAQAKALLDIDEWMGAIAIRHAVGDWDAFGYNRGKNMYAYKPNGGKWKLLHWDIAFALGLGDGPQTPLTNTIDEVSHRLMTTPPFSRAYYRTLYELATGPFTPSRVNAIIDAKSRALLDNGIPSTQVENVKNWIQQRREFILAQLAPISSGFSISSHDGRDFSTNRNTLVLRGNAPVQVKTILINGQEYPVTWTDLTGWEARVALDPQRNVIVVEGLDSSGSPVAGASDAITVTYTGIPDQPEGRVVINEIHYHPFISDAEFVELHNTSRNSSFDLSNFRLNGIGFTFPPGTVIPPGGFLVLARNPLAFGQAYGFTIPVAGVFDGSLDNGGETLTLLASDGTNETAISSVRYDDERPWPLDADGIGPSLQLVDPLRDPSRVGNWAIRGMQATPGATNSVLAAYTPFPLVWLNEVKPPSGAASGWVELYNSGPSEVSLEGLFLSDDYDNLSKWAFPAGAVIGAGERKLVQLDGQPGTASDLHASFTIPAGVGSVALSSSQAGRVVVFDYLNYDGVPDGAAFGAFPEGQAAQRSIFANATPAAANDLSAPIPRVFINEWMASNGNIPDPDDQDFDDWFELYNAGGQAADLSGFTLSDNPDNPGRFTIPNGTIIPAGGFLLVWADDENSDNGDLHANFALSANGETIGLFAPDGTPVDTVEFGPQQRDVSEGRAPDGGEIQPLARPTPGASNSGGTPIEGLHFTSLILAGEMIRLEWASETGKTYRVEYKNNLSDGAWTALRTVPSEGESTSTTDAIEGSQRFYRLVEE